MKISRRQFIYYSISTVLVSVASYLLISSYATFFKKIIRKDVEKLKVKSSDIDRFVAEAEEDLFFERLDLWYKAMLIVYYHFECIGIKLPMHIKYLQLKSHLTGRFLLSTDFFKNNMNVQSNINYLGFYNPYKTVCSNPFPYMELTRN